jgi:(2Fe-2S) ferredoxin
MNLVPSKIDFHFLICTNSKDSGKDCATKGAHEILEELKAWSKTQTFAKKIRINKSGCLGRCEEGVAAVAYPAGEWIVNARSSDLEEMKKFILARVGA